MMIRPSAVSKTPAGKNVGWLFPCWVGTSSKSRYLAAWKSII